MTFCSVLKVKEGLIGVADTRITTGTERIKAKKITIHQKAKKKHAFFYSIIKGAKKKKREKIMMSFLLIEILHNNNNKTKHTTK